VLSQSALCRDHERIRRRCLPSPPKVMTPSLVYLANPDNPMGSWHDRTRHPPASKRALPQRICWVLDEALCRLAPPDGPPPHLPADDRA